MARVLVTGGAGYIGSHACKALAAAGHRPVAFDDLSTGHRRAVKWGPLIAGDILDRTALDAAIAEHRPEAVLHFAAHAYVGESVENPARYYRNNIAGTLVLLDAMLAAGVLRIVFSSSCTVYGTPERTPIAESAPLGPVNPYGWSKRMVEQVLADYNAAYGLAYASLRYFNACGADPDGEIGEWHDPETHLIPRVLMAASGRLPRLDIFGDDYPTPDGTAIRDYVHVTDLAEAHVTALGLLGGGTKSIALNLGTGAGHSIRQVIAAAERATGRQVPVKVGARRAGDPPVLVADPAAARQAIGFAPRYSDLDTIMRTAWPFFGP
jgi:UDP-arabinose 4-epimerase